MAFTQMRYFILYGIANIVAYLQWEIMATIQVLLVQQRHQGSLKVAIDLRHSESVGSIGPV